MSRVERTQEEEYRDEIKKAEKRGRRKGRLARIKYFFIGILCGVLILTLLTSYMKGKGFVESLHYFVEREEPVAEHDLTLENKGILGFTVADFQDAILGDTEELKQLEVLSAEVSDVTSLTQAGLGGIKAFSKYQTIIFHGTAIYTVDLGEIRKRDIKFDEETKTLTLTVPDVELQPINIPSENIEFGDVEKDTVFAFGKMKVEPEEQNKVETEAKARMEAKLEADDTASVARTAAEHVIWEIFQPIVSGVSPEVTLKVEFAE